MDALVRCYHHTLVWKANPGTLPHFLLLHIPFLLLLLLPLSPKSSSTTAFSEEFSRIWLTVKHAQACNIAGINEAGQIQLIRKMGWRPGKGDGVDGVNR